MKTNKTIIAGALGLGLALANIASAQTVTTTPKVSWWNSLVSTIASKFNLNTSDVQKVVDDQIAQKKQEQETNRAQAESNRLAKAVTDGKLTQAQADLIKTKLAEVKTQLEALKGKTPQEIRDGSKTVMDNLKQWAKSNNIPEQFTRPEFGRMGPGMMDKGFGDRGRGGARGMMQGSDK